MNHSVNDDTNVYVLIMIPSVYFICVQKPTYIYNIVQYILSLLIASLCT